MAPKHAESKPPRKVKLEDAAHDPVTLLAICSSENEYRLSWLLNAELAARFSRYDQPYSDSSSYQEVADIYLTLEPFIAILIANKQGAGSYLLPKQKRFDYIFGIKGDISEEEIKLMLTKIRKIPGVITAIVVEEKVKAVQNLLSLF